MEINLVVNQAHQTAKDKGWWDSHRTPLEIHMLVVTELAEATEAVRLGDEEAERIELADAIIRIMDYFGQRGWNLDKTIGDKMTANLSRSYRHGGKAF
jgi:NTP pyrophosphatase (non-canonical NTP hydrolase)